VHDSGGMIKVVRALRVMIRDTEAGRDLIERDKCIAKY
jgi:hypothetical protein